MSTDIVVQLQSSLELLQKNYPLVEEKDHEGKEIDHLQKLNNSLDRLLSLPSSSETEQGGVNQDDPRNLDSQVLLQQLATSLAKLEQYSSTKSIIPSSLSIASSYPSTTSSSSAIRSISTESISSNPDELHQQTETETKAVAESEQNVSSNPVTVVKETELLVDNDDNDSISIVSQASVEKVKEVQTTVNTTNTQVNSIANDDNEESENVLNTAYSDELSIDFSDSDNEEGSQNVTPPRSQTNEEESNSNTSPNSQHTPHSSPSQPQSPPHPMQIPTEESLSANISRRQQDENDSSILSSEQSEKFSKEEKEIDTPSDLTHATESNPKDPTSRVNQCHENATLALAESSKKNESKNNDEISSHLDNLSLDENEFADDFSFDSTDDDNAHEEQLDMNSRDEGLMKNQIDTTTTSNQNNDMKSVVVDVSEEQVEEALQQTQTHEQQDKIPLDTPIDKDILNESSESFSLGI